ncbi:hypothetical protein GGH19_003748 [Coemansia sp. RSA 1807]|nr:hypothetical protein GGH16_001536 [Coemansia sp. RSA 560]KAJ2184173.1 hypothetical protein EV181_004519 [Coemansia sp. RSA 532]KAJ2204953.1 hypothetical protein IW145_003094 [Coemansia sp. RSA 521]KAJ2221389.1 hypothetical protein IW143_001843 [Coemansia sp. RSA 520]KAJ2226036.1 hypothetical protein EV180_003117 [Coemansia sp. RSA 518]KAJ2233424.1 hypothetical protein GGH97_005916 [Coemansia sp. RSA 475]KAJ2271113.1 hypothetical protein EV176_004091 [Coemansia sp. RSA 451]KAJ2277927.1 hyp
MKFAAVALTAFVLGVCVEADSAQGVPRALNRANKMAKIPKAMAHVYRRQDASADEESSTKDEKSSSTKEEKPSSTKDEKPESSKSPTPTPEKSSSADSKDKSATEEGTLEEDKPDSGASNNDDDGDNNDDNSGDGDSAQSDDVVTDADGNPIITDVNVSYWSLIQPTGVSYLSNAPNPIASSLGMLGAVAAVAAIMF